MKQYLVQRYYHSDFATYQAGDVLQLDDDIAGWLNRDSPGVIAEIVASEQRAVEEPPQDRMVRKPELKRQR